MSRVRIDRRAEQRPNGMRPAHAHAHACDAQHYYARRSFADEDEDEDDDDDDGGAPPQQQHGDDIHAGFDIRERGRRGTVRGTASDPRHVGPEHGPVLRGVRRALLEDAPTSSSSSSSIRSTTVVVVAVAAGVHTPPGGIGGAAPRHPRHGAPGARADAAGGGEA